MPMFSSFFKIFSYNCWFHRRLPLRWLFIHLVKILPRSASQSHGPLLGTTGGNALLQSLGVIWEKTIGRSSTYCIYSVLIQHNEFAKKKVGSIDWTLYIETVEMTPDKMSNIWRLRFILSKSSIESSYSWTKIDKFMLTKLIEILIEMECVKLNWLTSFQKRALLGPISLPDSHRFWLSFVSVASFFWRAIINCFSCLATFLATFLKGIYIIYWIL